MLFTEPCCKALKQCLECEGERTFWRPHGEVGPLLIRTATSPYETRGKTEHQDMYQAVIFCPFCGKQLQTADHVARYMAGEER